MKPCSIFIGWDPREASAFAVARHSAWRRSTAHIPIYGLILDGLKDRGIYSRPSERRIGPKGNAITWDLISDAPMSTEHANARFLIKIISPDSGWSMFTDGDVLFRGDVAKAFDNLDDKYAIYCVKHDYKPASDVKMDGQVQTQYARKNWSSVFILNTAHPSNDKLTVDLINNKPGRDLHRFCWLRDDEIGELGPEWNYLVGYSKCDDPQIVHFTDGLPDMPGYENCEYADEWRVEQKRWAAWGT